MSLIMGAHPEPMTTVIVQGSAADLAVPAEMSLTAPTIEFGPNRAADPSVSHTLASELGAWVVHLTEAQVAALSGLHYARLRVDDRIIAAGQVQHNPGWDGRARSRASTSIMFGPEAVALVTAAQAAAGLVGAPAGAAVTAAIGVGGAARATLETAINGRVDTAITNLINGAPGALDTLNELAAALGDDANFAATTAAALGNRLRVDAAQALDATKRAQAWDNVGVGAADFRKKAREGTKTISPDDFTGTDAQRIAAAAAHSIANGLGTILLEREFDLTGATITITKPASRVPLRFHGVGGGGFYKGDAGFMFKGSVPDTSDVMFSNLHVRSTPGAGLKVFDFTTLINVSSLSCSYKGVDCFGETTDRYIQLVRQVDDHVSGGNGAWIRARETIALTLLECTIEDRAGGVLDNLEDFNGPQNRSLRVLGGVIENNSVGPMFKLGSCWSSEISTYLELNGGVNDPEIDLHTYTQLPNSQHCGISIKSNQIRRKPEQVAAGTAAVWAGKMRTGMMLASSGNSVEGTMYDLKHAEARVASDGTEYASFFPLRAEQYSTGRFTLPDEVVTTATRPQRTSYLGRSIYDTDVKKALRASTLGTRAVVSLKLAAGATNSGNLTITWDGVPTVVAVTAGDTILQVRDKIIAAWFRDWTPVVGGADTVQFNAKWYGARTPVRTFDAAATGVTQNYFGQDGPGVDPIWVDGAGAATAATPINAQTGTTYTLAATDQGRTVTLNNAAAVTLTVPANVFTTGQRVDVIQLGVGQVTAVAGSSATINGTPGLKARARYSAFTVQFLSPTTAVLVGDLSA